MKERTLRLILDSIFFGDAMSPEFKKANDILLRIVKMNDRTGGIEYTRLAEINKAFKANDAKAARVAYDKLKPLIAKGTTELENGIAEARSKLSEASQKAEQSKAAFTSAKGAVALFDRFRKAIDVVKTKPAAVSKLSAYADKLKAYGDFSKRIAQMSQMVAAKKDVSKQVDMLAAACDKGKAKADKERVKAEKDYGAAKDRVSVFKEMEKIRSKKIAEFAKEKEDVQKLGAALPDGEAKIGEGSAESTNKRKAIEYVDSTVAKQIQGSANKIKQLESEFNSARSRGVSLSKDVIKGISKVQTVLSVMGAIDSGIDRKIEQFKPMLWKMAASRGVESSRLPADDLDKGLEEIANAGKVRGEYLNKENLVREAKKLSRLIPSLIRPLYEMVDDSSTFTPAFALSRRNARETQQFGELFDNELQLIAKSVRGVKEILPEFSWKNAKISADDLERPDSFLNELKTRIEKAKMK